MTTFLIGLFILIVGGIAYGFYCEKVFQPDDRPTPAITMNDGIDFVPMNKWKNSLIELLNIAGTGPIFGPIQGILFGPIAFILIPIGCVLSGALHDYMSGMICIRENGAQMPKLIGKYLGNGTYQVYNIFVCLLMLLVGAVFIYTPGDIFVTSILGQDGSATNPTVWIVYGIIFVYYLLATLFPIDAIIGRIYPIFGIILLLSAVGIFAGLFFKGYEITGLGEEAKWWFSLNKDPILPIFFVTIACGITSGFHSTQATLIARSVTDEREGKMTFFYMMILEGFIAMIWAAAAMGTYSKLPVGSVLPGATAVVGTVARDMLGTVGGIIALLGVVVLPITSGDTALRSLRLMLAEYINYDQKKTKNRVILSSAIFVLVAGILIFAKLDANGFNILWRYFAWSNQTIAIFAFAMITVYLYNNNRNFICSLLPGMFYCFIISTFILNAKIGFNIPMNISYIIGGILTVIYGIAVVRTGAKYKKKINIKK